MTPLKDGMNLVAKEYCAAQVDEQGVLVLSEFAGAASQLQSGALLVNPNDVIGTAAALRQAILMPGEERARRMALLRRAVKRADVYRWSQSFLEAAGASMSAEQARSVKAGSPDGHSAKASPNRNAAVVQLPLSAGMKSQAANLPAAEPGPVRLLEFPHR